MSQVVPRSRAGGDHPVMPDGGPTGLLATLACSGGLELEYPVRLVEPPSWLAHTPFALWLVGALKPRIFVELGVHTGNSYCAFLQGVQARKLETRCFGIDHWRGDEHSGHYGDEIYEELRAYHEPLYGAFSTLLRSSFDEAQPYFLDGSIDLLHIDGFHSYDAVAHDFGLWLPRMSARGVVLLHDTNVRERGFGIWRFWAELAARYPTFELTHAFGLGLAYVGREPLCGPFDVLFGAKTEAQPIRDYFSRLGKSVVERFSLNESTTKVGRMQAHLATLEADLEAARLEATRAGERAGALAADYEARLQAATRHIESQTAAHQGAIAQLQAREADLEAARLEATRAAEQSRLEVTQVAEQSRALAASYEARLGAATRHIESQTALLRRRTLITAQLQQDLFAARRTIDQIFRSKSWRFTLPIRLAGSTLKRVLGRSA